MTNFEKISPLLVAQLNILFHFAEYDVRFAKNHIWLDKLKTSIYFVGKHIDMSNCELSSDYKNNKR